jgi:type II pantothenate kinase
LIPKAVPSPRAAARSSRSTAGFSVVLGADVGASLTKIAVRSSEVALDLHCLPDATPDVVAAHIASFSPASIGLTGGGAASLARALGGTAPEFGEFEAWGTGAPLLLERSGAESPERFLLVSVGTGTSAMLVEPGGTTRVGGSALGGGTVAGLAAALLGTSEFDRIIEHAQRGNRWNVDLRVSDVYPGGVDALTSKINAASFAKLAWDTESRDPDDLADALIGLVGENVGLICGGLAKAAGVERIVYGGTTLRDNPLIVQLLHGTAALHGCEATFPADGEYTGAIGALTLACA